jgi:hypothetical protein
MHANLLTAVNYVFHRRAIPLWLVIAFMLGLLASPAFLDMGQAEPLAGTVSLDPPDAETSIGLSTSVDVRSDGASNIYGAQFAIAFDAAHILVVDADANPGNGVQISTGSCPAPDFVATNAADNTAGTIDYAVTQLNPTLACNGGVIATIDLECRDVIGTFPVTITESILSDPDGTPISHTTQHGQITCSDTLFFISGRAVPQGHPSNASGVQVCLDGTDCMTTDADGTFSIPADAAEAHTITADFEGHLLSQKTGITGSVGDLVDIGQTTLRAGDLNKDGTINILDLVMVGGNYNKSEPVSW